MLAKAEGKQVDNCRRNRGRFHTGVQLEGRGKGTLQCRSGLLTFLPRHVAYLHNSCTVCTGTERRTAVRAGKVPSSMPARYGSAHNAEEWAGGAHSGRAQSGNTVDGSAVFVGGQRCEAQSSADSGLLLFGRPALHTCGDVRTQAGGKRVAALALVEVELPQVRQHFRWARVDERPRQAHVLDRQCHCALMHRREQVSRSLHLLLWGWHHGLHSLLLCGTPGAVTGEAGAQGGGGVRTRSKGVSTPCRSSPAAN